MFGTIRGLCDSAVGDRLLRVYPIDPALRKSLRRLWKRADKEPKPFTVDQMQRFLAAARDVSKLARLYEVRFLAGLRLGELTGLQLDDDDIVVAASGKRKLLVERQLGQHTSMWNPEPTLPKGGKSRQVDAGARLCSMLAGLSDERKSLAMANGWRPVPPGPSSPGTARRSTNASSKRTSGVCEQAGLPDHLTPHSMRHFAWPHIGQGCNPKWLQQQMGHSSINVTLDTYVKWWNLEDQAAADALGALVGSEAAATGV